MPRSHVQLRGGREVPRTLRWTAVALLPFGGGLVFSALAVFACVSITPGCPPQCTVPVAGGASHSLDVMADGTVWAWGENEENQLGDGSGIDSGGGVQVSTTSGMSQVVSAAAGGDYSLALTSSGTVWSWGSDSYGQLGDGGTSDGSVPVQVPNLGGISEISAGSDHSLALRTDGNVFAWGDNDDGQLGDGTTSSISTPERISLPSRAISIAAGYDHSLALTQDGRVFAWGGNMYGQIGDGNLNNSTTPIAVYSNAIAIAAGPYDSMALRQDGSIVAWGLNDYGQLGNGNTINQAGAVSVVGLPSGSVRQIAQGFFHSSVLYSNGQVWSWGNNAYGQLGNNTMSNSLTPIPALNADGTTFTGATSIASGAFQTLAVLASGAVFEWGKHPDAYDSFVLNKICTGPTQQQSIPKVSEQPIPLPGGIDVTPPPPTRLPKCPRYEIDLNALATSLAQSASNPYNVADSLSDYGGVDYRGSTVLLRWGTLGWGKAHIDSEGGHGWGSTDPGSQTIDNPRYRTAQALLVGNRFVNGQLQTHTRKAGQKPNSYEYYYDYLYNGVQCDRLVIVQFVAQIPPDPNQATPKFTITAHEETGDWNHQSAGTWSF